MNNTIGSMSSLTITPSQGDQSWNSPDTQLAVNKGSRVVKWYVENTLQSIYCAIGDWLWPESKKITHEWWLEELEKLWYRLFYRWKNADLYLIPNTIPTQILIVRTDRVSALDVMTNWEVPWKWIVQNKLWLMWIKFAEERWFKTTNRELPDDIPNWIRERCQASELCEPVSMEFEGRNVWVEFVFRDHLTWSLWEHYKNGRDPYGLNLPEWLKQWDKIPGWIFTPTTKEKKDVPIESRLVAEKYPEMVKKLDELFKEFIDFAYERWYVVIDTKFELFFDSNWELCLWDEMLTSETSRFIRKEDFEEWNFISRDKQIARDLWAEFKWKERLISLLKINPKAEYLDVMVNFDVSWKNKSECELRILNWYQWIYDALAE